MKTNITICLDHELVYKLREEGNISQTINTLVNKHIFGGNSKEAMEREVQLQQNIIQDAENKLELLRKKLNEKPKMIVRHT